MMVDDFFTLAEIKDGLTSQSRVGKLVKIMQTRSHHADRDFVEAAAQRSIVASVLAATRSKDCLYLFIKLNGLQFFNMWLQDAQRASDKDYVSAVEESLAVLVDCLQKLPSNEEHIKSSGIAVTIKQLCDHSIPSIQSRARALFSRWNGEVVSEKVVLEKLEYCDEDPSDKGTAERISSLLTKVKTIDDAESAGMGYCSNHRNGLTIPKTQHGVIDLEDTKQSRSTIMLEPVLEFCDHLSYVLHDNDKSSDKSESTICHIEASVSAMNGNELTEKAAGDDHLDNVHDYEVADAHQNSKRITGETDKVVDNQFCNSGKSSMTIDPRVIADPRSVDLVDAKENKPNLSDALRKSVHEYAASLHNDDEFEACVQEEPMELSTKSNRLLMDFDLNQEFDSADAVENGSPLRSPISLPSLSIRFLDDHGKVSSKGTSCFTKHRQDLLDFDLNVAENVINIADDTVVTDQIPAWSSLPSGESSIEVSLRIADRQDLDLNCPADDTELSSNAIDRKVLHCSFHELQNPSTVSSSSEQSLKLNFNLNETLPAADEYIYRRQDNDGLFANKCMNSVRAYSQTEPAFVLMGSRVEIDRRKGGLSLSKFPHIQNDNSSMPAGHCLSKPNFFVNKPAAFSVTPPSIFHRFRPKPSSSSSSFYAPGSDANQDSDAVGFSNCSSRQNFDLVMVERRKGSVESSGPGLNRYMDGQRSNSQYPNSNGPKRKEPNDGWQTHRVNFTMQRIQR